MHFFIYTSNKQLTGNLTCSACCWWQNTSKKIKHLTYLSCLVVEPHQSVIPGQHLAVEGGVILRRATPGHGAPDLDRLIQVDVTFLKRVWIRAAGEHGQRWRHWGWLGSVTPTRDERQGFLIQTDQSFRIFYFLTKYQVSCVGRGTETNVHSIYKNKSISTIGKHKILSPVRLHNVYKHSK